MPLSLTLRSWHLILPKLKATRDAIHQLLQVTAEQSELNLWGGSADLGSSDKTYLDADKGFQPDRYDQKNIAFGIRESCEGPP